MRSAVDTRSTREQIVDSAMSLFGRRGIDATSLRQVARDAGVSPALIVHHFDGKEGLIAAVDEAALRAFGDAYTAGERGSAEELLQQRAEQTAMVMRQQPDVCAYIGRALVEVTPGASRLFDLMVSAGRAEIDSLAEEGALREGADLFWATLQHFFLIWAPLSFRTLLEEEVLEGSLLEGEILDRWVEANIDLLREGLYR